MFRQGLWATTVVGALLAAACTVGLADAAGDRGGYRGSNSGRSYSGYRSGNYSGYRSGYYGGYRSGYNPGYYSGNRYGYNSGYYGGPGISLGFGAYPYSYDYGYAPSVNYVTPSYYYSPSPTVATPDTAVAPAAYTQTDDRAHIEVRVPSPDAEVFFQGDPTQQRGMERQFVSPPLDPSRSFTYSIEARWMENGRMVNQKRTVTVSAGQTSTVDFNQ